MRTRIFLKYQIMIFIGCFLLQEIDLNTYKKPQRDIEVFFIHLR